MYSQGQTTALGTISGNGVATQTIDRDTLFNNLHNELAIIIGRMVNLETLLTALRDRTLGPAPGQNKAEDHPKPVPNSHVGRITERLDVIKTLLNNLDMTATALDQIG